MSIHMDSKSQLNHMKKNISYAYLDRKVRGKCHTLLLCKKMSLHYNWVFNNH
ncbi:Uncharacterised protein [Porphyromonas cangingivalis]|uniref:Uncharacterized protein n=1 Tax=Porphyromonas cangingivalis TaxID=36874 RepID=A0A1T4K1Y3_PORCN|nr:hypothetical protein SAMN02745205_00519 [Porphyromonas cangingivalis]SPY35072.1 Uncharacterised protein [Porphyromonas cangingivalis]VEJ03372.1 Uncharacterised protein [Porphyromonas cangingivalis]